MKYEIGYAITEVEKMKIEISNPILLYVALILGSCGLLLSLLVIIVYCKKRCMKYLIGYMSHKREKENANDKVKDIEEEAVEMMAMKTTDEKPNKDCKQEMKKGTLVFNFTDKTFSVNDVASK